MRPRWLRGRSDARFRLQPDAGRCACCKVGGGSLGGVSETVGKLVYEGDVHVRPYRRGTYLGIDHVETLIEKALGPRYSYGNGWDGHALVSIEFRETETGEPSE